MAKLYSRLFAISLIATVPHGASADETKHFHCNSFPIKSDQAKAAIKRLAHNNAMRNIILAYVYQWENEEIRKTCDAAASGQEVDFSCLDGRRDWDAIQAKIPDDLHNKSNQELRPLMLKLQEQGFNAAARSEALNYCERLGVIDRAVKG